MPLKQPLHLQIVTSKHFNLRENFIHFIQKKKDDLHFNISS